MAPITAPVYVSAGSFDSPSVGAIIDSCVEHRIYGVELGALCSASLDELKHAGASGLQGPKLLIHNYFPRPDTEFVLNLAADSAEIRTLSINHCKKAIDMCVKLEIPFYSFHAGFAVDASPAQLGRGLANAPRFPRERAYEHFIESLNFLCSYSAGKNVRLLIENNVVTEGNLVDGHNSLLLGADSGELARILSDVNSSVLGLLVDVGHLKVTAKTLGFSRESFLNSLLGKVEAFHLSDNDSVMDSHCEFDEEAWFLPHLAAFTNAVLILETQKTSIDKVTDMIGTVSRAVVNSR